MAQLIQTAEIDRGQPLQMDFTMVPATDITGWTMQFTLAANKNTVTKLWQTTALVVVNASIGTFNIVVPTTQTDREPGTYWFDVWRTNASNERLLAIGYLTIVPVVRLP